MDEEWYENMGFSQNPFETNPIRDEERSIFERDFEANETIYRIRSQNMLFVEGAKGRGKTALLKYAIDNFKGKGKVIYVDSNAVNKKLNIEKLITGAKKIDPLKEKYPKDMILLLDNVDQLSLRNNERIKYFFDQNYLKSVIFTGKSYNNTSFSESIRSRIGNRVIKLRSLSDNAVVDLVFERLGSQNNGLFSEDIIKYIYKNSHSDLKKLLINCYLVGDYAAKQKRKKVTKELVDKALKKEIPKDSVVAETLEDEKLAIQHAKTCEECQENLKKVGEYYRCKNCDTFCTDCGAVVIEEDSKCPECGTYFE